MKDDTARVEEAAINENVWVRARILKREPPAEGSLLKIAERARDMAANSLGTQHPAYAVAVQNLGLYYDAIENDAAKANECFAQARAAVQGSDLPLAEGFYWLGVFHLLNSPDPARAETPLAEALAMQQRALGSDDLPLAETMVALAQAKGPTDLQSAIALLEEALRIQRTHLPAAAQAVADTEKRLAIFQTLARDQKTANT